LIVVEAVGRGSSCLELAYFGVGVQFPHNELTARDSVSSGRSLMPCKDNAVRGAVKSEEAVEMLWSVAEFVSGIQGISFPHGSCGMLLGAVPRLPLLAHGAMLGGGTVVFLDTNDITLNGSCRNRLIQSIRLHRCKILFVEASLVLSLLDCFAKSQAGNFVEKIVVVDSFSGSQVDCGSRAHSLIDLEQIVADYGKKSKKKYLQNEDHVAAIVRDPTTSKMMCFTQKNLECCVEKLLIPTDSDTVLIGLSSSQVFDIFLASSAALVRSKRVIIHGNYHLQCQQRSRQVWDFVCQYNIQVAVFSTELVEKLFIADRPPKSSSTTCKMVVCVPPFCPVGLSLTVGIQGESRPDLVLPFTHWVFSQTPSQSSSGCTPAYPKLIVGVAPLTKYSFPGDAMGEAVQDLLHFGEISLRGGHLPTHYVSTDTRATALDNSGFFHTGYSGYLDLSGGVHIIPFYPCARFHDAAASLEADLSQLKEIEHVHRVCGVGFLKLFVVPAEWISNYAERQMAVIRWKKYLCTVVDPQDVRLIDTLDIELVEHLPVNPLVCRWACRTYSYHQRDIPTLTEFLQRANVSNAFEFQELEDGPSLFSAAETGNLDMLHQKQKTATQLRSKLEETTSQLEKTQKNLVDVTSAARASISMFDLERNKVDCIMEETVALRNRVRALEQQLDSAKTELQTSVENRQGLSQQLRACRSELEEERTLRGIYEKALERQQVSLNEATLKLQHEQEARIREHEQNALLVARLNGSREQVNTAESVDGPGHSPAAICDLMRAAEVELGLLQQTNTELFDRLTSQTSKLSEREGTVKKLESKCQNLQLENDVAVDFLLRTNLSQNSGQLVDHEASYVVTPRANRTRDENDPIVEDPDMISEHVQFLHNLFKERGIDMTLKRIGNTGNTYRLAHGASKENSTSKVLVLAIIGDRLVKMDEENRYTDLLDELLA